MRKTLRLGTRGSPLALLQAEEVRKRIFAAHPHLSDHAEIEIVPIRTSGDWRPEQKDESFREIGGNKELFTKEIEEALLGDHIDMAVHSMKDVSSQLPRGLGFAAMLPRVDPRDAFISRTAKSLNDLSQGATVGTSSLRRQAQLLAQRPDLHIVPLRGNVETRLKKIDDGMAEATLLAMAGLIRLSLQHVVASVLEPNIILPAAGQGAIGIEARSKDTYVCDLLAAINDKETTLCVTAERAFLRVLDGNCHTPIGALAWLTSPGQMKLEGLVAKPDGTSIVRMDISGAVTAAEDLGVALGNKMKGCLPKDFYAA